MTLPKSTPGRVTGHVSLKRRKTGTSWYMKWREPDGRQVQRRIGPAWEKGGRPPAGHFTRRMAEEALEAKLTDVRRGAVESPSGATFADAAAEFLRFAANVQKVDPSTVKDYRGVVNGYLLDEFGPRALESITPDDVDAYKERLIAEGRLSARVIVRHLTVLHGVFKRAKRKWKLAENPAAADVVERPRLTYTGEFDTFDRDEVERLAAAAADRRDAALYVTAAYTGLRQGELLALRWRDVDLVAGLVHVRRNFTDRREKVPKGRKVRAVPLMARVADELARLKDRDHFAEEGDLVFGSDVGDHLDAWALRRRFYKALETAELRRIRFHDLRHHFGSLAITVLDPFAVQSYMGHQHYSTTQRYLHHKPRPGDASLLQAAADASDGSRDLAAAGVVRGGTSDHAEEAEEHEP